MIAGLKRRFKTQLLKILRRNDWYIKISLTPKGNTDYAQVKEFCKTHYYNKSTPVTRNFPKSIINTIPKKFEVMLHSPSYETFVIEVNNWRVWGNQGAVITNKGYLLKDASREYSESEHSIYKQISLIPYTYLPGTGAVIAASGCDVYFHWMFDIIPRIDELKKAGIFDQIDYFILNYNTKGFQKELLKMNGISESKLLITNDHWSIHFKVEKLFIPSLPSPNDSPSLRSCLFLRELFQNNINTPNQNKRIYIQRKISRVILNESELLTILKEFNFDIVQLEDISVEGQARIFSQAEIVVGAHGAGFTNIVFCKPDTYIIDLFSPLWINPCYWIISNHLNLKYNFLIGETKNKNTKEDKNSNMNIDIKNFGRLLSGCLNND